VDAKADFYAVLTEAVTDLAEHGFDSVERVASWTRRLRDAAARTLTSSEEMARILRDGLEAEYRRMIDQGKLLEFHAGSPGRFTIDKVRPALRAELDRRIAASADLIKLNRQESIDRTMRRFQGWATSIPVGGSAEPDKRGTKKNIRKSLAQLPFEDRRVIIDQGHKLVASISNIVASDGGAIALRWSSRWRQAGYNYREEHKDRDGKVYLLRGSWAHNAGYVRPGDVGYYDQVTAVAEEPFCRCSAVYIYALRDLPADMLTAKGRAALEQAKAAARADSEDCVIPENAHEILRKAEPLDRMNYLHGIKEVRMVREEGEWNAQYDPDEDAIDIRPKLLRERPDAQVHILLHEIGHRGQEIDAPAYEAFKSMHMNKISSFLHMANHVHLADFQRKGHVDNVAEEVWAESYARAMLGLPMPDELALFWRARMMAAAA
jgi:hypothetical protein